MEFVGLGEEKPEDPEDEDPLQNQVVRRSLRKTSRSWSRTTLAPRGCSRGPRTCGQVLLGGKKPGKKRVRPSRD